MNRTTVFFMTLPIVALAFLTYSKTNGQDTTNTKYSVDSSNTLSLKQDLCEGTPTVVCCTGPDGCFDAIHKGQAVFHTLIILPPALSAPDSFNFRGETTSPFFDNSGCHISRSVELNRNLTVEEAFNCETAENTRGQTFNMGSLYASIWWEIYNHEETSKEDINTLFLEHLPVILLSDTFRTVAPKIIDKARELFDESKGEQYARIISQEFTRRGLSPIEETAG